MKEKSYAVIGLGQFGYSVAVALSEANCDVLAIDGDEEKVHEVADKVVYAVRADVREEGALKSLGVQNVDVAVIAISESMEASISAAMQAKDLGVPYVIAKANNEFHGRILNKIGVDEVIYPEHFMGLRVAKALVGTGFASVFELSPEYGMVEFHIPEHWIGKSLAQLNVRMTHHMNIIGVKVDEQVHIDLRPDWPLPEGCTLIAIGKEEDMDADAIFGTETKKVNSRNNKV